MIAFQYFCLAILASIHDYESQTDPVLGIREVFLVKTTRHLTFSCPDDHNFEACQQSTDTSRPNYYRRGIRVCENCAPQPSIQLSTMLWNKEKSAMVNMLLSIQYLRTYQALNKEENCCHVSQSSELSDSLCYNQMLKST